MSLRMKWVRHATGIGAAGFIALATTSTACLADGPDDAHYTRAREVISKAIDYLRTQQDSKTGGWAVPREGAGAHLPGITGLILHGMLMDPDIGLDDPYVNSGLTYLLSYRQDDGGIYDTILPNYNTAMALSALARVNRPDAVGAIKPAQDFLRGLQWAGRTDPDGEEVTRAHPFFGGAGYGQEGRPDNSNLQTMLEGLHDSGLDCNDPAFRNALVFLQRTQMLDEVNDMAYADGSEQGGFIYSTSPDGQHMGLGESKAGTMVETTADGESVTRLQAYGSMTYAGFKSYLYANLDHDDLRVKSAYDWIRRNYTLEHNPGVGMQGYYYYLVTFSRALDAWGGDEIVALNPDGTEGDTHQWRHELIDKIASLQRDDGSFVNETDRWMEGNPVLVTGYCLLALQYAID